MINIDENINSCIEESANSYLNDLGHVYKGIVDRFNSFKIMGETLEKNITFNSDDIITDYIYTNNSDDSIITNYTYTETVQLKNREIETNLIVTDEFARINLFETIKSDEEEYNELTVDIFKCDNKITMYSLKNHRINNKDIRIGFDEIKMVPEICDYYDIDINVFKTKEGSLLYGIDLYHRTRGYKKKI